MKNRNNNTNWLAIGKESPVVSHIEPSKMASIPPNVLVGADRMIR